MSAGSSYPIHLQRLQPWRCPLCIFWQPFGFLCHYYLKTNLRHKQPCTQRNIFGSHWLLNVQTLVARAKNELFWKQVSYFTDSACQYWSTVHKFLHHSHASPSSPSLLRLAPPQKKIKDCCRFDTFLVSLSTPQLLSKLYLVCFEYSWAESLVLLYICIYIVILYCTCFVT